MAFRCRNTWGAVFWRITKNHNCRAYSSDIAVAQQKQRVPEGPDLQYFLNQSLFPPKDSVSAAGSTKLNRKCAKAPKVLFEIHGCQMNHSDGEVAWSVLQSAGYERVVRLREADVILILTCAIREGAEQKIWERLEDLSEIKKRRSRGSPLQIGLLGCMAERLKENILEKQKLVDLIVGPDAYRDLPKLLDTAASGQTAVNVILSKEETYADILPVQLTDSPVTAFVSIQRGCDNFCSFCIVPFVRGRERSRPVKTVKTEIRELVSKGVKEVTLLGQNVNSYRDISEENLFSEKLTSYPSGFSSLYKPRIGGRRFAELLDDISGSFPELRIRFQAAHPKDFPDELLMLMRERPNICKQLHLPAQSGSTEVLNRMRRGYSREAYLGLVERIRHLLPDVSLTSDMIAGFCEESEEDHNDTLDLIRTARYNFVYAFPYSAREKTTAHRRYADNVPPETKNRRFQEIVKVFREEALKVNSSKIGSVQLVLVEGESKRSPDFLQGRSDCGVKVIFPKEKVNVKSADAMPFVDIQLGDYVAVEIQSANSQTLHGLALHRSSLSEFYSELSTRNDIVAGVL
ncbi:mitochondrial tRNA methylthiotransferase CDK5RAP1-like [Paramacrobiotus metropolitanus]|uniref:mitochondrial tRNA methylthiotransferase CDK5RAP1-like n=1 Tax=Paramacrobiotus metropolitanus TaxID=2943436 RepID=UPI0024461CFB|nr:mitochondrial tRNA methylthiotransferase CDK5RAP1-like [Paramacrobiotus metropolitanus]